jgi:hypothetical protein
MTMSRRHWAAVATTFMVVVVVAMLLQYSRAMALRYSGLSEPPARSAFPARRAGADRSRGAHVPLLLGHGQPKNGLVPDRYPTPSFASVAAVGFGLTSYAIGVERGYVTRKEARKRVLTTLRFLWQRAARRRTSTACRATRASSIISST